MIFTYFFAILSIAIVAAENSENSTAANGEMYYKTSIITDVKDLISESSSYFYEYLTGSPDIVTQDYSNALSNPDIHLDTSQLVSKFGYVVETHLVTTEDGYILTHFRITGSEKSPPKSGKPVVYLQHGIMSSSDDFVSLGPSNSLAYVLVDNGYDVWIGNTRGNYYSRNHNYLNPDSSKFWFFTWHEMGFYDLPATVDHILSATGNRKLFYIGHSLGTTIFFVMLAEKPEYNEKISAMIGLAPAAYLSQNVGPFVRLVSRFSQILYDIFKLFDVYYIDRNGLVLQSIRGICLSQHNLMQVLCHIGTYIFGGYDGNELNWQLFAPLVYHYPDGVCVEVAVHSMQLYQTQKFQQRDYYSSSKNKEVYGQSNPPEYNLTNVRASMTFMYAENDKLADPLDVHRLVDNLPIKPTVYKVPQKLFGHGDFLFGRHALELIYKPILEVLNSYSNETIKQNNEDDKPEKMKF